MLMQKPARILAEKDRYNTKLSNVLGINEKQYELLIIPYMQFISQVLAEGIEALIKNGGKVLFLESLPEGVCDNAIDLPVEVRTCEAVKLHTLIDKLKKLNLQEIIVTSEAGNNGK